MRLIDADELRKKLDELYAEVEGIDFSGVEGFHLFQDGIVDAQYAVDEMPTIDAVPVIRCKDCKWCQYCNLPFSGDEFCSDGERKEEQCRNGLG